MKSLWIGAILVVIAGCSGVPAAIAEAEQVCKARGFSAGSDAYRNCMFEVTESIYDRWGRKHISRGD